MRILDLVEQHERKRLQSINLVASENLMSPEACKAMQSDLTNRYCMPPEDERPPGMWDYPNQEWTYKINKIVVQYACEAFGGKYGDVRPLSGNNVAYIILKSLVPPGGHIFSVPGANGGHFTTAEIARREGFSLHEIPYDVSTGNIDINKLKKLRSKVKPDLVFLDASMQLFPYPVSEIREVMGDDVVISFDASHTMGLVIGGCFQSPLSEGADLVHGSTHKSLFGPQKGLIVCKNNVDHPDRVAERISNIVSPLFVSNMHIHNVAALGIALEEMKVFGNLYASQVIKNAKAFATELQRQGINVLYPEKGFTESHQVMCRFGNKDEMKMGLENLGKVNLHANGIKVPFSNDFGFRFGLSEVTRRGFVEKDVKDVAGLVGDCLLKNRVPQDIIQDVKEISQNFPSIAFCLS